MLQDSMVVFQQNLWCAFPNSRFDQSLYTVTTTDAFGWVRTFSFTSRGELFKWLPDANVKRVVVRSPEYYREFTLA